MRCPSLYCIITDDEVNPPELGEATARGAAAAELRLYPGGHFEPFIGETFERVVADQVGVPGAPARPGRLAGDLLAEGVEHLLDPDELDPRAAVGLAAADLGLVDRLPVLEADEADAALGEQRPRPRPGPGSAGSSSVCDSTSASRCWTVSSASFLLVPITPEGPRLIQPAV